MTHHTTKRSAMTHHTPTAHWWLRLRSEVRIAAAGVVLQLAFPSSVVRLGSASERL